MSPKQLHTEAMELYVKALELREEQRTSDAWRELMQQALDKEMESIALLRNYSAEQVEPTLTILLRSAATIALECGVFDEARRAAVEGLYRSVSYTGSKGYYYELFGLLDRVEFDWHLSTIGVELDRTDIQMSLASGLVVSPGLVHHTEVSRRITSFESLMRRTYERKRGVEYRASGSPDIVTQRLSTVYMHADARANSFAVTLRVGKPTNDQQLPFSDSIVDEILTCMELVESEDEKELKRLIPSAAYFNHCIASIRQISPDGTRIGQVGFTYHAGGKDRRVSLQKHGADVRLFAATEESQTESTSVLLNETIIEGRLEAGDLSGHVRIDTANGKKVKIEVPVGLEEFVRSYFGLDVRVQAQELLVHKGIKKKKIKRFIGVDAV